MLIVGAGGFALDFLSSIQLEPVFPDITFFVEESQQATHIIQQNFPVINSRIELQKYFSKVDKKFIVAIGDNKARERIAAELIALGGEYSSFISSFARIGKFNEISKKGTIILHDTLITNGVKIGEGNVIYCKSQFGHFTNIGKYNMISSQFTTSSVTIGNYNTFGINAVVKPLINIGDNNMIGIGSVVVKDIGNDCTVKGNPAK